VKRSARGIFWLWWKVRKRSRVACDVPQPGNSSSTGTQRFSSRRSEGGTVSRLSAQLVGHAHFDAVDMIEAIQVRDREFINPLIIDE
jgi:hypothetical protein